MKRPFLLYIFLLIFISLSAQPKHEIRAVWLTTNYGLDWPARPIYSQQDVEEQKKELCSILDKLKDANFNMVFVQARLRGNVIYSSRIEPYSSFIKRKKVEDYDPLAYTVEACHERGLECHAWFVTYPLGSSSKNRNNNYPEKKGFIKKHDNNLYLDPGNPETNNYLLSLITELVSNYDIDGLHFDYIRYPENASKFPDKDTHLKYGNKKDIHAWRRENINKFVYMAYDKVKEIKPWVQISSSVIGMYEKIPGNTQRHWTAYESVYQDPVDWIKKGKHDFIVPMMYYTGNLFFPFIHNWTGYCQERFIVPGIGIYRMESNEGNWNCTSILDQIDYSRKNQTRGNVYFRTRQLLDNKKNILNEIKTNFYSSPAQLPPLIWLDSIPPSPPLQPDAIRQRDRVCLSWEKHPDCDNEKITFSIYRSEKFPVNTEDMNNLVAARIAKNEFSIPIDTNSLFP